jgi:hypothetical protein
MIDEIPLLGTTDTNGDVTITATRSIIGKLYAVSWIDGDLADGVDGTLSVTVRSEGAPDLALLTLSDANSDAEYMPREPVHDNTGTALTYNSTEGVTDMRLINGTLALVIASGGNTKTGGMLVYVDQ